MGNTKLLRGRVGTEAGYRHALLAGGIFLAVATTSAHDALGGRISGLVTFSPEGTPASSVLVRAWDSDAGDDTLMAEGTTNSEGRYELKYADKRWDRTPFAGPARPDIYLEFLMERPTTGSPFWQTVARSRKFEDHRISRDLYVNEAILRRKGSVDGSISWKRNGKPTLRAKVQLRSPLGLLLAHVLGESLTDMEGHYHIDYEWFGSHNPDLFVHVQSPYRRGWHEEFIGTPPGNINRTKTTNYDFDRPLTFTLLILTPLEQRSPKVDPVPYGGATISGEIRWDQSNFPASDIVVELWLYDAKLISGALGTKRDGKYMIQVEEEMSRDEIRLVTWREVPGEAWTLVGYPRLHEVNFDIDGYDDRRKHNIRLRRSPPSAGLTTFTGTVSLERTISHHRPRAVLKLKDGSRYVLRGSLEDELRRLASAIVSVEGHLADPGGLEVLDYSILSIGGGTTPVRPMVGNLTLKDPVWIAGSDTPTTLIDGIPFLTDGIEEVPLLGGERLHDLWLEQISYPDKGPKMWVVGSLEDAGFRVTRFGFLTDK